MRKIISVIMVLAFVITTTVIPAISHAMPHDSSLATQTINTEVAKNYDCHGNNTAQNDKDTSKKCCDKGICKCIGNNCHSISKYLGNSSDSISAVSSTSNVFALNNQFIDSALPSRFKRPPKA